MTNLNNLPALANTQTTVDVVILSLSQEQLKVLLVKRTDEPYRGQFALPGGFLWEGETSRDTANRILKDKAGVGDVYLEQLYTFDSPQRDPRGHIVSITYFALVPADTLNPSAEAGLQDPALYSINDLPELAFDHRAIIDYAVKRLRSKLSYTNIVYSLLPIRFTLSHLQKMYEIIQGKPVDKRNFRKKYLSLGLIRPTSELFTGGRQRPAQLFEFVSREPVELDRSF